MKKFFKSNFDKIKTLFSIFGLNLIWIVFIVTFIDKVVYVNPIMVTFFMSCIFAPLWEELLFRYVPIQIVNASNNASKLMLPVVIGSSILFGLAHGGPLNILTQGVGGLFLSYLYIKYESYWLNVLSHALWNFFVVYGVLLF